MFTYASSCNAACRATLPNIVTQVLEAAGALPNTVIVACDPDASLGRKLATLCAAAAVGERIRDEGGHSLVLLDDGAPLISE
jgi:F0F1-type ATP synthase alpha subunit